MIQARGFSGKLNQDDSPFRLPAGDYTDALNITRDAQGAGNDEIITNVPGNEEVNYAFSSGTNKVIGNYADKIRNRQYIFVWNSTGYHEITYYDANLNTIVKVIKNLTDTGGVDILKFDPSWKINHIDIIYRDEEGDLLYWTDGLNPPRKVNVKTALLGGYGVIISSYLDVAKEPPSAPPYCAYENDASVTVNNLQNRQFKFKYRFVFDDLEKSVTSSQSEVPIPYNYTDPNTRSDSTKNCVIRLILQTGPENVKKIEILGSISLGVSFSDYFIIQIIDKADLSLNNNDVFSYLFYNDKAYVNIPIKESIQPFDLVPLRAYTQSLPNGNVLDYGAITEGYNLVPIEVYYYFNPIPYQLLSSTIYNSILITAYQNAQPVFGQGNIKIIVSGIPAGAFNSSFNISTTLGNIIVNITPFDTTLNAIAIKINAAAVLLGFTSVSIVDNVVVIFESTASIVGITYTNPTTLPSGNSQYVFDWSSKYGLGIVYFDEKGRTNGVYPIGLLQPFLSPTLINYEFTTPFYFLISGIPIVPYVNVGISSRPPEWAHYYQIVRTRNLSKSNWLYWISAATAKDTVAILGNQYAYISIGNIQTYKELNKNSIVSYEFTVGDRIRFCGLYSGGTLTQTYADKDFEILESLTNPNVNGTVLPGQVLKIYLPTTNPTTFDFGNNFSNYFIQIYTPAQNFSEELNIYYEFGERFEIGNPGTNLSYHQGNIGNQNQSLTITARSFIFKGDCYFRYRNIPTGGYVKWSISAGIVVTNTLWFFGNTLTFNSTILINNVVSSLYVVNNTTSASPQITAVTTPVTFNLFVSGSIEITLLVNAPSTRIMAYYQDAAFTTVASQNILNCPAITANQKTKIDFSGNITFPITAKYLVFGLENIPNGANAVIESQSYIIVQDNAIINQAITDLNFSDDYDSSATPNGRAWKVEPNALQVFNPALIRFGDEFQPGTTINNTNRFYEDNFDVYDRSKGGIKKMFIEGRNQYIFQQFDVGVVTILTQIVRDTAGNPLSAQSDKLLNKIVYPYQGGYGIGEFPESFAYGKNAKYFIDGNKGVVVRLAQNGMTPISIVYKMNAFFVPRIAKYKDAFVPTTGRSTIYGAFDAYTNKYIIAMEEVYDSTPAVIQDAKTIAFLETATNKEGFESFLSFLPENMGALNNQFFSFKAGQIWKHLTPDPISGTPAFCNFYNTQYSAEVQVVFNETPLMKKYFLSIMESANTAWECPAIQSQLESYAGTPQLTAIVSARFKLLEGQYYSAIFRDINSKGGLINGAIMHGNYLIVRFKKDQASSFVYLNAVSLNYKESPLNIR